jgi:hypothetical protein
VRRSLSVGDNVRVPLLFFRSIEVRFHSLAHAINKTV